MKKILATAALMISSGWTFPICSIPLTQLLFTKSAQADDLQQIPKARLTKDNKTELEPKALSILKDMCDKLSSAHTMSFTAVVTYESPSRIGPALSYTTISKVTLQRPDKLQIITPGDGPASEIYYNGKTITAYAPSENLVATSDAPTTIDALLKFAYDRAAIYFPFTDLIVSDPYKDITEDLNVAFYMGKSVVVDGITTDMIVISNDKVFAQIWIGANDKLPRMIRAVFADDPLRLRHQMSLSNWQLGVPIAAGTFTSSGMSKATRIEFKHPSSPSKPSP